ncbi:MAG TPA: peptidylprolyl isomerase, partial [Woeseiaceae bacterium]|nr:peptidylprolyl isomerase [Woeseiaceae bacterium]
AILFALAPAAPALDGGGWRNPDPANTVHLQLPDGEVIIELKPDFAPQTVAQFKRLVADGFYDGLTFYRVIDGFVAQGGDRSDMTGEANTVPALPAEFERAWADELSWTSVQEPDLFAPETGFIDGFAAARDLEQNKVWLAHCPGVVAMARNNEPDTGSTDFYIVIGQAPRYLDRNLTIFGRVIDGMEIVQRIIRGKPEENGMIPDGAPQTGILRASLGSALPPDERGALQVQDTNGSEFRAILQSRRIRGKPFFHHKPPEVLDVCQVPVATQRAAAAP